MNFNKIYDLYLESIKSFFSSKKQATIKEKSQYFTPFNEADKLLEGFNITQKDTIKILDPSCGGGILILKTLDKISKIDGIKFIEIDCYDIDPEAIKLSKTILEKVNLKGKRINFNFYCKSFLEEKISQRYDYILMNPPYKKINMKEAPEDLKKYLNGQPNLYYLFIAKSLELLEKKGNLAIISPKSYLSGKYTEKLRKFIISGYSFDWIHTFDDRRTIFKDVIQEVCIVNISKKKQGKLRISNNGYAPFTVTLEDVKVPNQSNIIITPRNLGELALLKKYRSKYELEVFGKELFLKPGKVVQFRVKNGENTLKTTEFTFEKKGVPLLIYRHINQGIFDYGPKSYGDKEKAITLIDVGIQESIYVKNSNYILLKKNVDKGEGKLIKAVPYYKEYLDTEKLGIDNGLAYITNETDSLTKDEIKKIYDVITSEEFEIYYHMFNSNHAINVYELENMWFPTFRSISKSIKIQKHLEF